MQVCSVPGCRPRENVVGEQLCRRHINVACANPNNAALIGIPPLTSAERGCEGVSSSREGSGVHSCSGLFAENGRNV